MAVSARRWSQLTLLATLATSAVLTVAPVYSTASCGAVAGGPETCTTGSESLLEHEGASVLIVLAVPVLVSAMPLAFSRRGVAIGAAVVLSALGVDPRPERIRRRVAIGAAVVLTALAVLGGFSIGLFYFPAVLLAWLAAVTVRTQPNSAAVQP